MKRYKNITESMKAFLNNESGRCYNNLTFHNSTEESGHVYSYDTIIAVYRKDEKILYVSANNYSRTTARQIRYLKALANAKKIKIELIGNEKELRAKRYTD